MKKSVIFVISLLLVIVIALGSGFVWYRSILAKPLKIQSEKQVEITKGDTLYSILEKLDNEKELKNKFFLKLYIKSKSLNPDIKTGKVTLKPNMSVTDLISAIVNNNGIDDSKEVKITIPEGYTIEQIATTIGNSGICSKEQFLSACKNYQYPEFIKKKADRKYELEGFLFPDTYVFSKTAKPEDIIKTMLNRLNDVIAQIEKENNVTVSKDKLDDIVNLSSIVEKEVINDNERKGVAGVFYNRLSKNMPLQSDITVLYALGIHKEKVTYEDLKVDSPYNTYKVAALPAGPICSPGKPSLEAAIVPEKNDYLYFIATKQGNIIFNKTYEDHLKDVQKHLND